MSEMSEFWVIIAGGREFNDYELLKSALNDYLADKENVHIVSGTARGADKLGECYAREHNLPIESYPANWDAYGKSAGYKRNKEMAKVSQALVAFWDGESRGTSHMIDLANDFGLFVDVVLY